MPNAFIIGAGQIGRAIADTLCTSGWTVAVGSRHPIANDYWNAVHLDRADRHQFLRALDGGADLLVDTIGYDAGDADQLLDVQATVGHIITISSTSVYCDDQGRTLDEARQNGFPTLPEPMTETQTTVPPGPQTYSTRKVAMERRLFDNARVPVSVLRPGAIHGRHSRHPREWWFVKRLLDGRERIPLAHDGLSRFHTSATVNIAALAAVVAARQAKGIFNAVDPVAPTVRTIGETIMNAVERTAELVAVKPCAPRHVGATPWSVPKPFVLSDAAGRAIGYQPAASYAEAVQDVCRWLATMPPTGWEARFPQLAAYPWPQFDYEAEEAVL